MKSDCKKHGKTEHKIVNNEKICLKCHQEIIKPLLSKLTKDEKEQLKRQKIKKYKIGDMQDKLSIKYWHNKFKYRFKKKKLFLIEMEMRNGSIDSFTVSTSFKYFECNGGLYVIDPDMGKRDILTGLTKLYYHQDCSAPFKLEYNIDELHKSLDKYDNTIKKALNPSSFKEFFNSQVIEKILKGQELSDQMRQMKMFLIIIIVIVAAVLILNLKAGGII